MPDINEEILFEVKKLSIKLYGENGFEGDIPEIKANLKDHNKKIRRIEIIIAGLVVASGGIAGITQLLSG